MHLCLVTLPLTSGGAERLIIEQANYFAEQSHRVSILTTEFEKSFVNDVGLDESVDLIPSLDGGDLKQSIKILKFCWANDVDVVESHYKDFPTTIATEFLDVDLSLHINGSPFWFANSLRLVPHTSKSGFEERLDDIEGHREFALPTDVGKIDYAKARVYEVVRQRAINRGSHIFTLTKQSAKELEFLYGRTPEIVPPGVDSDWADKEERQQPDAFPNSDFVLLNVGRLDKRKRNELLIEVVSKLQEKMDVGAVIAGSGEQGDALTSKIKELGLSDKISLPGYVPDNDLPAYYTHADVVAHPAWVAYGLVPLEAYLMDTPVAISTDSMVKEILEGAPAVEVLDPAPDVWADGLEQLLNNTEDPDKSILPTWKDFGEQKMKLLPPRN